MIKGSVELTKIAKRFNEVKKLINSAEEYSEYALGDSHSALSDLLVDILEKLANNEPIDDLLDTLYEPAFNAYLDVLEELMEKTNNYANKLEERFVDTSELRITVNKADRIWDKASALFYDEKKYKQSIDLLKDQTENLHSLYSAWKAKESILRREAFVRFFKILTPFLVATLAAYISICIMYLKISPVEVGNLLLLLLAFVMEYFLVWGMLTRFKPVERE